MSRGEFPCDTAQKGAKSHHFPPSAAAGRERCLKKNKRRVFPHLLSLLFFFGRAKLLRLFFIFRPRLCGKRGTRRRKGRGRRRLYCCTEQREKCNPGEKESSSFSPFPQPFFLVCGGRASASWLCSIFPIPFLQGSSLFPPGGEGGRRRHNTPSLMPTNQPTSASSLSIRFCTRLREGKKPASSGQ